MAVLFWQCHGHARTVVGGLEHWFALVHDDLAVFLVGLTEGNDLPF